jgi:hypothetical protein
MRQRVRAQDLDIGQIKAILRAVFPDEEPRPKETGFVKIVVGRMEDLQRGRGLYPRFDPPGISCL